MSSACSGDVCQPLGGHNFCFRKSFMFWRVSTVTNLHKKFNTNPQNHNNTINDITDFSRELATLQGQLQFSFRQGYDQGSPGNLQPTEGNQQLPQGINNWFMDILDLLKEISCKYLVDDNGVQTVIWMNTQLTLYLFRQVSETMVHALCGSSSILLEVSLRSSRGCSRAEIVRNVFFDISAKLLNTNRCWFLFWDSTCSCNPNHGREAVVVVARCAALSEVLPRHFTRE